MRLSSFGKRQLTVDLWLRERKPHHARARSFLPLAFVLLCASILSWSTMAAGREWTDSTGSFRVEAELVDVVDGTVVLGRPNGSEISVPVDRLSAADQRYLRSMKRDAADRIEMALERPCQLDLQGVPLSEVVSHLTSKYRINIRLDARGLGVLGVSVDLPVGCERTTGTLAEGLDALTDANDLAWCVIHDVVLITTPETSQELSEVRLYKLRDPGESRAVIQKLCTQIARDSWPDAGGLGSLTFMMPDLLVVGQTCPIHRQIKEVFGDQLQVVPSAQRSVMPALIGTRMTERLNDEQTLHFIEMPLCDVVEFLTRETQLKITLDESAMQDVGVSADVLITENLTSIPLRSALSLMLRDLDLTWTPHKGGIRITTREACEADLQLFKYEVFDMLSGGSSSTTLDMIQSTVMPESWEELGGCGTIRPNGRAALDIRQTFDVHLRVSTMLAELRQGRKM